MKRKMNRVVWALVIGAWAVGAAQAQTAGPEARQGRVPAALDLARAGGSRRDGTQQGIDLQALKAQLEAFQTAINQEIAREFTQPFVLLQDAKGTYLPGYGAIFHLEVNLHPLRSLNMFNLKPYTEEELQQARKAKLEKLGELKTRLSALLLEHGAKLTAVPADQNVAMVVHLFNMPSERGEGLPTQLVMETSRKALLEAQKAGTAAAEFEKRQSFLEF